MPRLMKSTFSFATTLESGAVRRVRRKAAVEGGDTPTDADALRALAWLDRGKPQAEIVDDEAAPKQTKAELARFHRASYRRKKD